MWRKMKQARLVVGRNFLAHYGFYLMEFYHDYSDQPVTTTAASPIYFRSRPATNRYNHETLSLPRSHQNPSSPSKIPKSSPLLLPLCSLSPAMDSDPGPLPPDDGLSNPDPNPNADPIPEPEPEPEPKPQEYAEEERLNSLTLEDSGNAAGVRLPASNGSLSADFYSGDEIEEEEPAAASYSVDEVEGAAGDARASSSHGGVAWRENSVQDGEAPPSPSSSGYAGGRGSSGESEIEEVDDGGASLDGWSCGKEHLDEANSAILCLFCGF